MRILLDEAAFRLRHGEVVAIPTETVYGLAASIAQPRAVSAIFELKGRPRANPLIAHVLDARECLEIASSVPVGFEELAQRFWPGPLTFVLPVEASLIPEEVRAGLPTCAFRSPAHPLTQALLARISPLVAPSANPSGRPSATRYEHIESDFGRDFPVLDGGPCLLGLESTIIGVLDDRWHVLRQGAVTQEVLADILGYLPEICVSDSHRQPICPGQLFEHYAPKARLILSTTPFLHCPERQSAVLGFSDRMYEGAEQVVLLGAISRPQEVAARLYDGLRELDAIGLDVVWVDANIPNEGLWRTIGERLRRAAGLM